MRAAGKEDVCGAKRLSLAGVAERIADNCEMGPSTTHGVLVIEDHENIANLVRLHVKAVTRDVTLAFDGYAGLAAAESKKYDLIILDVMLPGIDGLEICRRLRSKGVFTPILMLTAKSTEADKVTGLDMGADDYLVKPFSVAELVARVKALLRRRYVFAGNEQGGPADFLQFGELMIDVSHRKVMLGGAEVPLTVREFDLLLVFAQHPGRPFTRSQLLDLVWGYDYSGYEDTVKSHINRLRNKLEEDPARPRFILTVWGLGYRFAEPERQQV